MKKQKEGRGRKEKCFSALQPKTSCFPGHQLLLPTLFLVTTVSDTRRSPCGWKGGPPVIPALESSLTLMLARGLPNVQGIAKALAVLFVEGLIGQSVLFGFAEPRS